MNIKNFVKVGILLLIPCSLCATESQKKIYSQATFILTAYLQPQQIHLTLNYLGDTSKNPLYLDRTDSLGQILPPPMQNKAETSSCIYICPGLRKEEDERLKGNALLYTAQLLVQYRRKNALLLSELLSDARPSQELLVPIFYPSHSLTPTACEARHTPRSRLDYQGAADSGAADSVD